MRPALLALLVAAACSPRPEPVPPQPPVSSAPDAGVAPAEKLPPGVLAQTQGTLGKIQVIESAGLRQLVVDGVVHATVPVDGRPGADPVVALARALRPKGKTALVIGLGSGVTAGQLAADGWEIEAVELEPAIIDYAKKYFAYRGKAVAGDGHAFLMKNPLVWDLVLMDASGGNPPVPPQPLVSDAGLALLAQRTAAGGLTLLRLLDEPRAPEVDRMRRRLRDLGGRRFVQLFGSGVGDERQNLYLASGDQGINFVNGEGVALWPISVGDTPAWVGPEVVHLGNARRRVKLAGYLVRLRENGAIALDLPHWEMGATRYLLKGDAVAQLAKGLPARATFPTAGDISSDGDPKGTLHELLGGGGVKRSDVRFSPVVVVIEGIATLRSVVDPDASAFVPERMRGDAPTDPLLPYGGALYDLEVEKVIWTADAASWAALRKALDGVALTFARELARPALGAHTVVVLQGVLPKLSAANVPTFLPPAREFMDLLVTANNAAKVLPPVGPNTRGGQPAAPPPTAALLRAIFCDKALSERKIEPSARLTPAIIATDKALLTCAITAYEVVAGQPRHARRVEAAGRALVLWDLTVDWEDPKTEKTAEAHKAALRRQVPGLEEVTAPLAP